MSSWLNREKKRKLRKNASLYEIQERFEAAKAEISGALLAIPVAILHEKYGWSVEECNKFNLEIVDKYNDTKDIDKFRIQLYMDTGIGIGIVEDEKNEGI